MSGKLIGAVIALVIVAIVAITSLRLGYFAFQAEAPQDSNQAVEERQRREAEQRQAELKKKQDEERKLAEARRPAEQERQREAEQRQAELLKQKQEEEGKVAEARQLAERERLRRETDQRLPDLKQARREEGKVAQGPAQPESKVVPAQEPSRKGSRLAESSSTKCTGACKTKSVSRRVATSVRTRGRASEACPILDRVRAAVRAH
jgi:hypothetical protein